MFKRLGFLICVLLGFIDQADAQIVKEFVIREKEGFNSVKFDFSSYKGTTLLQSRNSGQPVRIHAHLSKANIMPSFTHEIEGGTLISHVEHQNVESENLGRSLSYRLFTGENESFDHSWIIDLDSSFLYDLNFRLGLGRATLDLSHLPVSKCKIESASADVALDYSSNTLNSASMDTMMVSIKMGTINAKGINYSNAKNMIFDVNYGTVNLSFAEKIPGGSTISALVGAGSVNIDLPSATLPYIIKVKSTAMCRTSVPKYLKEIENEVYVSKGYEKNAEDLMTFLIDISVGSISLK